MTIYQHLIEVMTEQYPEALVENYRHSDGTIRQFRFTDHTYIGIGPALSRAPILPEHLLRKIPETDENNPMP